MIRRNISASSNKLEKEIKLPFSMSHIIEEIKYMCSIGKRFKLLNENDMFGYLKIKGDYGVYLDITLVKIDDENTNFLITGFSSSDVNQLRWISTTMDSFLELLSTKLKGESIKEKLVNPGCGEKVAIFLLLISLGAYCIYSI